MPHVITQNCCNDASCVAVCPVDCIHPRPDEPGFASAEMLYINPDVCVDCGACVLMCPVDAITTSDELVMAAGPFTAINAAFAATDTASSPPRRAQRALICPPAISGPLRVAVIGAGPAGLYAAEHLLTQVGLNAEVTVFDRLPTPWGLVRAGVAPDHQSTKNITDIFRGTAMRPGFSYRLGVEVGRDVTHAELLTHYHAVVYAVGAHTDQRLGIPGEELPGSHSAREFVAWYNGHPDHANISFDFSGPRAVVVGNGNVALDVARILLSDPDDLARTDIADYALKALRNSNIREVVILGRRGLGQAAFTVPELIGLTGLTGVTITAEGIESDTGPELPVATRLKRELLTDCADQTAHPRRVVLRFLSSPVEILGDQCARGVRTVRNTLAATSGGDVLARPTNEYDEIDAGLVLRSVGYRGTPIPGLPFDDTSGTVPNEKGRVLDANGELRPGTYVTGWIKRGPSGVIGTNRQCAAETIDQLLDDAREGRLPEPTCTGSELDQLLVDRVSTVVEAIGWNNIDQHERRLGSAQSRPRVKITDRAALLRATQ
ncbi:FAD-dependent oxidoreductase [Mycobacterium sp. SM3041]|uniref:FAD-dependent oxidoreductase n=1 Tax=Mycobacterium sp. SM3041 TaxID=3114291 RepID=UPI003204AFF9